jgi:hypothetical protein
MGSSTFSAAADAALLESHRRLHGCCLHLRPLPNLPTSLCSLTPICCWLVSDFPRVCEVPSFFAAPLHNSNLLLTSPLFAAGRRARPPVPI